MLVSIGKKFLPAFFICFLAISCKHDPVENNPAGGYPPEIGEIILTSCAVAGCHNDASHEAAAGLNLTTWEKLFEGSNNNAAVVPYRPDQSFLMFFINTNPALGPVLEPTMPYNQAPLTEAQILTINDWIARGAPDAAGFVKFSDNAQREKLYIANQACDLVAVMDLETRLIMRYIDVGISSSPEAPHNIKVSPDGAHWYVCMANGSVLQKFRTSDDSFVGTANIGHGIWNTFAISSDSRTAYVVDWQADGNVAVVDLETMTLKKKYFGLLYPHGSALDDDQTLYVTAQTGNFIYKFDLTDADDPEITEIPLAPGETPAAVSKYDAHEIAFSHDKLQYAVTCQKSNEVRFFNAANDSLLAVVPAGEAPLEIAFSERTDHVFITCTDDRTSFPGKVGAVYVINYKTHDVEKKLFAGFQPHGIAIDHDLKIVFVANRNTDPSGPAPHHSTDCSGRNGYLTLIDLNTLEMVPGYRAELSVDPYFIAVRQ